MTEPVLRAVLRSALDATGAARGWIVGDRDGQVVVLAADGTTSADVGSPVPAGASASVAMATGQPAARRPHPGDAAARGAAGSEGVPATLLTVPCGEHGAIELADKHGDAFDIDDIEIVSLLAEVAAAAISASGGPTADGVPGPEELAVELRQLHAADRSRYAFVARAVSALLAAG